MRALFEKVPNRPGRSFHFRERRLPRFDAPWHFHPEIELTLIVSSRGRRFVGDCIEPFEGGDLVLLGANLPHFWHNEGRQPAGKSAHSAVAQFLPETLGEQFWKLPECASVRRLLIRASRGLHFTGPRAKKAGARLRALGRFDGLPALLELIAILQVLAADRTARPLASFAYEPSLNLRTAQRLARVYAFLTQQFREPLTLAQIAQVAAMTPPAFSRYFRRATGRNVSTFLNELRVDHAAQLLAETSRTVADVAAAAGYATLSNFNRRFRDRLGMAPRQYRDALSA